MFNRKKKLGEKDSLPKQEEVKEEVKVYKNIDEYTLILLTPDGDKIPATLKVNKSRIEHSIYTAFQLQTIDDRNSNCFILHQNFKYIFTNKTMVYRSADGNFVIGDDANNMRIIEQVFIKPHPGLLITEFVGKPYEIIECVKVED